MLLYFAKRIGSLQIALDEEEAAKEDRKEPTLTLLAPNLDVPGEIYCEDSLTNMFAELNPETAECNACEMVDGALADTASTRSWFAWVMKSQGAMEMITMPIEIAALLQQGRRPRAPTLNY
eukprot:9498071-Pyramimonas_sp.AAC.2